MSTLDQAEREFVRHLRDLAAAHADIAEAHGQLRTGISGLLELGSDADHDEEMQALADELRDGAATHEELVDVHGDFARFFFGIAEVFESGDWEYSDVRMVDEMIDCQPEVAGD